MRPKPRPFATFALWATLALLSPLSPREAGAQSLTADDVINRYIARVGGMERINAVTSVRRTGKFIGGGGFEARIVQENSRPNKVREEFTLQGMTAVNAWDGSTGWKIDPFGGKKDPEPLSEDEMHGILLDSDFDDPLVNYAAKGHTVQLVGMDEIEGTDVYKLRVAMANGDTRLYYMDKDSFVPIRMEETRVIRGAEQQFETNMGDYKPVAGWLVPFAYETGRKGQDKARIAYDKIEANPSIDAARYTKPGVPVSPAPGTSPSGSPMTEARR